MPIILLPLFYPTGRLPSARWRVVIVIAAALVVTGCVTGAIVGWPPALQLRSEILAIVNAPVEPSSGSLWLRE